MPGGGYRKSFLNKIKSLHSSGRVFDGIVPDRYGAVEALCIADHVVWLDDHICVYNSCGKNTWSGTLKKGYESLCGFVSHSREDKDYSDGLFIPGVVASVYNIIASDYHNAVLAAVSSNYCKRKKTDIDSVRLAVLAEKELMGVKHISEDVLDDQKKLVSAYIRQFDESKQKKIAEYREMEKKRKRLYFMKSGVDGILRKGMSCRYKPVEIISTELEKRMSKDSFFVKALADIK